MIFFLFYVGPFISCFNIKNQRNSKKYISTLPFPQKREKGKLSRFWIGISSIEAFTTLKTRAGTFSRCNSVPVACRQNATGGAPDISWLNLEYNITSLKSVQTNATAWSYRLVERCTSITIRLYFYCRTQIDVLFPKPFIAFGWLVTPVHYFMDR